MPKAIEQLGKIKFICPRCKGPIDLAIQGGRCPTCGFAPVRSGDVSSFVDPNEADQWLSVWDRLANEPAGDTSSGACYRFAALQAQIIEAFKRTCRSPSPSAMGLDVGCGSGIFWQQLFATINIVGVDYSLGMCKRAEARGMPVIHANAQALPFANEQFDLVYSAEILQYIKDVPALLRELGRVTRTGGQIVMSTMNQSSLQRQSMYLVKASLRKVSRADPSFFHTAQQIARAVSKLPLQLRSVTWIHFPFGYSASHDHGKLCLCPACFELRHRTRKT